MPVPIPSGKPCLLPAVLAALVLLIGGCASGGGLRAFSSDGCSLFPDGTLKDRALWCDCCLAHDKAYWRGGTDEERRRADEMLRDCVSERTHDKALAEVMFLGVRAGGHPAFPAWYRWGYGWSYGRGYAPLTEEERKQAGDKLEAYAAEHPQGYCRERHRSAK